MLLLVPSYFFVEKLKNIERFKPVILGIINERIDGKLKLGTLKWTFQDNHLGIKTEYIGLFDKDSNLVIEAKDNLVIFNWDTLIFGLNRYRRVNSKHLTLNISRDEYNIWNLQRILKKKPEKRSKWKIQKANVDKCVLRAKDLETGQVLAYDDLYLSWEKKRFKKNYSVDVQSHKGVKESNLTNYFKISGILPLSRNMFWTKSDTKLDFVIANLNLTDFRSFLKSSELFKSLSGVVNSVGVVSKKRSEDLNAKGALNIKDFYWNAPKLQYGEVNLDEAAADFDISISKKYLLIWDLALNLNEITTGIKGKITDWSTDNPKLDLTVSTEQFGFKQALRLVPKTLLPKEIRKKVKSVYDGLVSAEIGLKGSIYDPRFDGDVKLEKFIFTSPDGKVAVSKDIDLDLNFDNQKINIKKCVIPLKNSNVNIEGWVDSKDKEFSLKLDGIDIPLIGLRNFIISTWLPLETRRTIGSFIMKGYANLDLNLSKKKNKAIQFKGKSKFAKVNISSLKYPEMLFQNMLGDLEFNNKTINIAILKGYIGNDYFETKGKVDFLDKTKLDLKFAARQLDLKSIINFRIFEAMSIKAPFVDASGLIKDTYIDAKGKVGDRNFKISGSSKLENVSIKRDQESPIISNINGAVSFAEETYTVDDISFVYNDAPVALDGFVKLDKDKVESDIRIESSRFLIDDLIDLARVYSGISFERFDRNISDIHGLADFKLAFKDGLIDGFIKLSGGNLKHSKINLPFRDVDFDLLYKKDSIVINSFNADMGTSAINITGILENYINKPISDVIWDLKFTSNITTEEVFPLMHHKFKKFFSFKGKLPLSGSVSGNMNKSIIEARADLNKLSLFGFSNWLVRDESIGTMLESRLTLTPKSVVSNGAKIIFTKGELQETINSIYQVKNIGTDDYKFYLSFETENEAADVDLIGPHISILDIFDLDYGRGNFKCDTFGAQKESQTICSINVDDAVAKDFNIGDLKFHNTVIDLFGTSGDTVHTYFSVESGDWNGIPFNNLEFDLTGSNEKVIITDLKANSMDGNVSADYEFNILTEEIKFDVAAQSFPAHELAQGVWGYGADVPAGLVDGTYKGTTKGLTDEEIFANLVGESHLIIKNGELSHLKTMQKYLSAVNSFGEGGSLDLNNIMQTLITYNGGKFNYLISSLKYDKGVVDLDRVLLKADQIEIEAKGKVDYFGDRLKAVVRGLIPRSSKSILGKVGVGSLNLGNVFSKFGGGNEMIDENKRFFKFDMEGKISDETQVTESIRESFEFVE